LQNCRRKRSTANWTGVMRDGQLNPDEQKADKLVTINIEG